MRCLPLDYRAFNQRRSGVANVERVLSQSYDISNLVESSIRAERHMRDIGILTGKITPKHPSAAQYRRAKP
jgi:hypothetical protein